MHGVHVRAVGHVASSPFAALHAAPVYRRVAALVEGTLPVEVATLMVLAFPDSVWSPLPPRLQDELRELTALADQPPELRLEVEHLRRQLIDLRALDRGDVCDRCAVAS